MTLVRRLAVLLGGEGVALVCVGLADLVRGDDTTASRVAGGAAVGTGLVLVLLGVAIGRGRSWARSPALVLNVFPLPIAAGAFSSGAWQVGLPLAALSGTALYLLFHPETRG